jgi:hypothetical protein
MYYEFEIRKVVKDNDKLKIVIDELPVFFKMAGEKPITQG